MRTTPLPKYETTKDALTPHQQFDLALADLYDSLADFLEGAPAEVLMSDKGMRLRSAFREWERCISVGIAAGR